jgi:hypothetical protein
MMMMMTVMMVAQLLFSLSLSNEGQYKTMLYTHKYINK